MLSSFQQRCISVSTRHTSTGLSQVSSDALNCLHLPWYLWLCQSPAYTLPLMHLKLTNLSHYCLLCVDTQQVEWVEGAAYLHSPLKPHFSTASSSFVIKGRNTANQWGRQTASFENKEILIHNSCYCGFYSVEMQNLSSHVKYGTTGALTISCPLD